jgi:hypothetical protein
MQCIRGLFVCSLMRSVNAFGREVTLSIQRCHAARACSRNGLAVGFVRGITTDEYTFAIGA